MRLHSGALSVRLEGSVLRDIRVAGWPALDAVYAAVRDTEWQTVTGDLTEHTVTVTPDGFRATWRSTHHDGDLRFSWAGEIEAEAGRLRYALCGAAESDFAANRIGICLLHPQQLAGHAVVAHTGAGPLHRRFPTSISPSQPFTALIGLTYRPGPDNELRIRFTGDEFETEDHRNWTDPGWKTYSTPLARPYPVRYRTGDTVTQTVELDVTGAADAAPPGPVTVRLGRPAPVPEIEAFDAHGHVDLVHADGWEERVPEHARSVSLVGGGPGWWSAAADRLAGAPSLRRVGIFAADTHVTPAGAAPLVRARLRAAGHPAAVGGGSRLHFAELNRMEIPVGEWDFVTYPVCPQVHHADDESILATLLAQRDTLRDAMRLVPERPVVVGPVSLRARSTPASPADPADPADDREDAVLGQAWLLGTVAALAGASALTLLQLGASTADLVAQIAGWRAGVLRGVRADPHRLVGVGLTGPRGALLLLANPGAAPVAVRIGDVDRLLAPGVHRIDLHPEDPLWIAG